MKEKDVILRVENLTKKFKDLLVLDDVSFNINRGELLCVVGPTGCGKTTFLNSVTKLYDITEGQILLNNEPVNLKKHNISYIFQEQSAFPWLTVEENVGFGLKIKKTNPKIIKERVSEVLDIVGLSDFKDSYPSQLSASMLQRVVIARAFATKPDLLLMDEPYAQLDIELRFKLEDELVKLWQRTGTTVLFITHNVEEAVYLSEKIMILTNKPTKVKQILSNDMPRPRDITGDDFISLRNQVTELIKWW